MLLYNFHLQAGSTYWTIKSSHTILLNLSNEHNAASLCEQSTFSANL